MSRCPECGQTDCCGGTMSQEIEQLQARLAAMTALVAVAKKVSDEFKGSHLDNPEDNYNCYPDCLLCELDAALKAAGEVADG